MGLLPLSPLLHESPLLRIAELELNNEKLFQFAVQICIGILNPSSKHNANGLLVLINQIYIHTSIYKILKTNHDDKKTTMIAVTSVFA